MSEDFDIVEPTAFTTGAVGKPGERVFYIQIVDAGEVVSLRCEKGQVGSLAEYLNNMLTELPPADWKTVGDVELVEPIADRWIVGSIAVAYDENIDRVVLVIEELAEEEDDRGKARVLVTRDQVRAFVRRARSLIVASRIHTNGHGG